MLDLAIKARIPIIRVHTSDLLNLPHVLEEIAGKPVVQVQTSLPPKGELFYATSFSVSRATYESLALSGRTLILVNTDPSPYAFDAGEIPVPKSLVENLLSCVSNTKTVEVLLPAFAGLTLKQCAEVIRLLQAEGEPLSRETVARMRARLAGHLQGLEQVSGRLSYYRCDPKLAEWIAVNRPYFLESDDPRLVPRGVLLTGQPGVGKSSGAKHIAAELGVPLYRLDLAGSLGMYVGQSESNLSRVLSTLDREAPACLLIDEVEKLFAKTEDQGITSRLLSQLLWWLAEHQSRVLTVMTCNDVSSLLPELYRAGRVDSVFELAGLSTPRDVMGFARQVLAQFLSPTAEHLPVVASELETLLREYREPIPHAVVVQTVIDLIKVHKWA